MVEKVRTIGQVMRLLTPEYPDLSISKIRYLESEGLLSPERAPSGYRKYSEDDIQRLRYILTCQRDRFLPLKVIRENLELIDRGKQPPSPSSSVPTPLEGSTAPNVKIERPKGPVQLTRRQLIRASGITEAFLLELERRQLSTSQTWSELVRPGGLGGVRGCTSTQRLWNGQPSPACRSTGCRTGSRAH